MKTASSVSLHGLLRVLFNVVEFREFVCITPDLVFNVVEFRELCGLHRMLFNVVAFQFFTEVFVRTSCYLISASCYLVAIFFLHW